MWEVTENAGCQNTMPNVSAECRKSGSDAETGLAKACDLTSDFSEKNLEPRRFST